jgi:hypothetical protein
MLTIDFDPRHPQEALETCAHVAELLGDYIGQRRQELDMPEGANVIVSALCDAVATVQARALAAIPALIAEAERQARPAPPPARARDEVVAQAAAEMGLPEAEVAAMIERGLAIAQGRAPAAPPAPPAPRLVGRPAPSQPAAGKRRRAA